jgi:AraC-like DNA-binding protein
MSDHDGVEQVITMAWRAHRASWLDEVIAKSQALATTSYTIPLDTIESMFVDFGRTVRPPVTELERLLLRAILLDVAWRCGYVLHDRIHRHGRRCRFMPASALENHWVEFVRDPQAAFVEWAHAYSAAFRRAHPPSHANRAAEIIQKNYRQRWSVNVLAERVHATPARLRRAFREEYGRSIRDYQRTIRIVEALKIVRIEKIDAVAMQIGYRSKKDFYHAFVAVAGLTPAAFRELPAARAGDVADSITLEYRTPSPYVRGPRH